MSLKSTNLEAVVPAGEGPLRRQSHTYELMRQCIHCGFCLPTCPTYAVLGVETDSPRGRIYQMQAVAEGRLEVTEDFIEHMYCCVGCRACETACPSGVQFGKLIEAAREQIQLTPQTAILPSDAIATTSQTTPTYHSLSTTLLRRFFFDLMLPSRTATALVFAGLKLYQRSGLQTLAKKTGLLALADALPTPFQGKLTVPEELMTSAKGPLLPEHLPEITPASGEKCYRVAFVSGCIMD